MSGLDLYQAQRALALLFVYAAVLGFALGVFYDALRFLRVFCGETLTEWKQGSKGILCVLLRFITDLVFSLVTAITLILLCYYENDGQFRASALWGMVGGFFVYMQTVGRLTARVLSPVISRLKQGIRWLFCLTVRPALWVRSLTAKAFRCLFALTVGKLLRKKREARTKRITEALVTTAGQGFGLLGADTEKNDGKAPKTATARMNQPKNG